MARTPLRRLLQNRSAEEASFVSPAVNRVLTLVGTVERFVLRRVDLPFGLSILLVGRVSDAGDQLSQTGADAEENAQKALDGLGTKVESLKGQVQKAVDDANASEDSSAP